jgi:hypothetical protein
MLGGIPLNHFVFKLFLAPSISLVFVFCFKFDQKWQTGKDDADGKEPGGKEGRETRQRNINN